MKKKKKDDSWLKPRGYVHFTTKFNRFSPEDCKFLSSYVSNPKTVAQHSFFPLIHRPMLARRYKIVGKDESTGKTIRKHSVPALKPGTFKSNAKTRHIYYATHIDAYIYSYFSKVVLGPLYEKKVAKIPGLSDCICAYRKIPVSKGANNNKCNIHFANDVFKFITKKGSCVALTFDVSAFFDSLNQKHLKRQWANLLGGNNLPDNHHNVFKSLTRISFVEFYSLLKVFGIKNQNKLRGKKNLKFCNSIEEFQNKVRDNKLIRSHPYTIQPKADKPKEFVGIPQGTPISAFLSNLYMLEFDELMHEEIVIKRKGLYKRYSDDIVIICNNEEKDLVKNYVINTISEKYKLSINKEKVDVSVFTRTEKALKCDKPLRYLGFEFNGDRALIKSASLAKFYRQMIRAVKSQARKAYHNKKMKGDDAPTARMYKHDLYKRHSHLSAKGKDRSFYLYARDASKVMGERSILNQLSNSWKNLDAAIKKYEKMYKLKPREKGIV